MRIRKNRTTGSQAIHVGRLNLGVSTQRAYPIIKIIDRDEEHIGFLNR